MSALIDDVFTKGPENCRTNAINANIAPVGQWQTVKFERNLNYVGHFGAVNNAFLEVDSGGNSRANSRGIFRYRNTDGIPPGDTFGVDYTQGFQPYTSIPFTNAPSGLWWRNYQPLDSSSPPHGYLSLSNLITINDAVDMMLGFVNPQLAILNASDGAGWRALPQYVNSTLGMYRRYQSYSFADFPWAQFQSTNYYLSDPSIAPAIAAATGAIITDPVFNPPISENSGDLTTFTSSPSRASGIPGSAVITIGQGIIRYVVSRIFCPPKYVKATWFINVQQDQAGIQALFAINNITGHAASPAIVTEVSNSTAQWEVIDPPDFKQRFALGGIAYNSMLTRVYDGYTAAAYAAAGSPF